MRRGPIAIGPRPPGQSLFLPELFANSLADRPDREDIAFGTLRNLIPRFRPSTP
jgi:hypothetical protein